PSRAPEVSSARRATALAKREADAGLCLLSMVSPLIPFRRLGSRQLFGEAFQALRPARLHPCKVCGRMGDHGASARLQSEFRLGAVLSEEDGCEPVEDRISLIVRRNIGENEPLRLHDLAIHTPARIFDAGGGAHDDTPGAADPR